MPRQSAWIPRIPLILAELGRFPAPVLDRPVVESLFRVSRRRAQQLLVHFGGYPVGRTYLIARDTLVDALNAFTATEVYRSQSRRYLTLVEQLAEARRVHAARRRPILLAGGVPESAAFVPEGVELVPGQLIIRYETPEQCLERLWHLARAVAADYERFCTLATGRSGDGL